jgi:N-acetylglucosamine-6-phosphate deacetylase
MPDDCEIIDAQGLIVSPGLIDVHMHGSGGYGVMDSDFKAIEHISRAIAKNGVTSFLPTTMTASKEAIYNTLDNIRHYMNKELEGATVLGAHLEGPFINKIYKGAQAEEHIIEPNFDFIADYTDVIKLLTYAPELDKDFAFTKKVKAKTNIVLSMGHTAATLQEAKAAVKNGCSHATHLFNAMVPLNHREPGVIGCALTHDIFCEIIADNTHINPLMYQFVWSNKGTDKTILITDSVAWGGMDDGTYSQDGKNIIIKNGTARFEDGTLVGSALTLNKILSNFKENVKLRNTAIIFKQATINPATSIGIDHLKGSLEVGKDADIALFDKNFNCYMTICRGRKVYNIL